MSEKETKIRRVGNSNGVILQEKYLFASGLKLGDVVEFTCGKDKITIKKKVNKKGE